MGRIERSAREMSYHVSVAKCPVCEFSIPVRKVMLMTRWGSRECPKCRSIVRWKKRAHSMAFNWAMGMVAGPALILGYIAELAGFSPLVHRSVVLIFVVVLGIPYIWLMCRLMPLEKAPRRDSPGALPKSVNGPIAKF